MLKIRRVKQLEEAAGLEIAPGQTLYGFYEDTDYIIALPDPHCAKIYIDDVELISSTPGEFLWRPSFYAGRVVAEVKSVGGYSQTYCLDVCPSEQKSGKAQFAEMVTAIHSFDSKLLGGVSAATMTFGHEGLGGIFSNDIQLSRVRAHGKNFLDSVEAIARAPHRSISANHEVLPLSRVRKLHPTALRDRRLVALAAGISIPSDALQSIQLRSVTSSPTLDTPANRTLLSLLNRFQATVVMLREMTESGCLGISGDEQDSRRESRLLALNELERRSKKLILARPFSETSKAMTSSSGLTQIAAQPIYSKAYRLGSRALATGIEGVSKDDALHVANSWGIYETWCYLAVLESVVGLVGENLKRTESRATSAVLAFSTTSGTSGSLEVLFQANFPSLRPSQGRQGFSISRMRIPDIVLIERIDGVVRTMVLDAKWRSGRENVLDAMQSAHIYHDSLRVDMQPPSPCILLFPGNKTVPDLEQFAFISSHGVGAISEFNVGKEGINKLRTILGSWLTLKTGE